MTIKTNGQPVRVDVQPPPGEAPTFTAAEIILLTGMANGLPDSSIGRSICPERPLTIAAVRCRVNQLKRKCGWPGSRVQLVVWALHWGVLGA